MASSLRQHYLRNTVWNYIGFAVNLAVNLLLFPLAIARMGDAATGVWLLIGSVSGYMGLLQLGLSPAMCQFASAHIARGDHAALRRTVSTAMAMVLALGSFALFALPAVPWMVEWFSIPEALRQPATTAFVLGIVGVPLQMPGHVFASVLVASQRQDKSTHAWMVSLTGKLVGISAVLAMGYGLEAVMWVEFVMIVVADVVLGASAYAAAPQLQVSTSFVSRRDAVELFGLGGWMFANALSSLVIEQTDRLVIGLFVSVVAVTQYSAAWKLYMLVYSICTTMVYAVGPVAANLNARGDLEALQRLWSRTTKYSVAVAWPMGWSLGLCAGPLLSLWLGSEFARHHDVVQVLVVYFLISAHNHVGFSILTAMRRVGPIVRRYSLPQAVLNLGLSLVLVKPLGILGVALGTVAPLVILQYGFLAYLLGALQLQWTDIWTGVVRPTAVPAIVCFMPALVVYAVVGPLSPWLFVAAGVCSVGYALVFWRSIATAERDELLQFLPAPLRAVLAA